MRQTRTRPRQAMSPSAVDRLERKVVRLSDQLRRARVLLDRLQVAVTMDVLPTIRRAERR